MAKPDYRLKTLFEIREKAKDAAEKVFAEKMAEVARQKAKHDEMRQELRAMIQRREAKKVEYADKMRSGELNITAIQGNDRHIDRLKQEEQAFQVDINRQLERVRDAENVADEARDAMLAATTDFKALEKHKEKWAEQVKKERAAKEEDEAGEVAQAQYFLRKKREREDNES